MQMGAISQKGAEFLIRSRLADAEAGDVDALFELGITYSTGRGGAPVDLIEAHKWFNLAALVRLHPRPGMPGRDRARNDRPRDRRSPAPGALMAGDNRRPPPRCVTQRHRARRLSASASGPAPHRNAFLAPAQRRELRVRHAEQHQIVAHFLRPASADRERVVARVARIGMAFDPHHDFGMPKQPRAWAASVALAGAVRTELSPPK